MKDRCDCVCYRNNIDIAYRDILGTLSVLYPKRTRKTVNSRTIRCSNATPEAHTNIVIVSMQHR